MRKFVIPAAAAALLGCLSMPSAASAVGMIKNIDTAKDMIMLDIGTSYFAPSTIKLSDFKVGQKVNVTYVQSNGKMEVSAMKPAV